MARTDNMKAPMGSISYTYDPSHHNPSFHYQAISSSSTQPDLSGFDCNIGPSHHYDLFTKKYHEQHPGQASLQFPLSPPPTNSDPKRSVPLPTMCSNTDPGPSSSYLLPSRHFGGILDSPVLMKHVALGCHAPISPPPTQPTSTLALPPTDNDLPSIPEHDSFNSFCLPSPSSSPDGAVQHLLSPLSPEWATNKIASDLPSSPAFNGSVLLHETYPAPLGTFQYQRELSDDDSPLSRPILPLLDIPDLHYSPRSSWSESPTSALDMELDDELDNLSTPISSPPSSFSDKLPVESDLLFDDGFSGNKYPFFHRQSSPSIHHIQFLPEFDYIPTLQSSPSLRSFSSLPQLDLDEDDDLFPSPPSSPGRSLLSLPGADVDDDLVPADLAPYFNRPDVPVSPYSTSRSLLLLDDPNDVPPPRSPSPENFYLDPALIENCSDPDIQRLSELRKKCQAAERAARQLETLMLEQGSAQMRWDARKTRKKEKERGREIAAMLRLKLADKGLGADNGDYEQCREKHPRKKKTAICSMEHLVAKMMLQRNDTSRPLAHRKTPLIPVSYMGSPLTRTTALPDEGGDGNNGDYQPSESGVAKDPAQEDRWSPPSWPKTLYSNVHV